jgi:hypothetical protein
MTFFWRREKLATFRIEFLQLTQYSHCYVHPRIDGLFPPVTILPLIQANLTKVRNAKPRVLASFSTLSRSILKTAGLLQTRQSGDKKCVAELELAY